MIQDSNRILARSRGLEPPTPSSFELGRGGWILVFLRAS